MDYPIHYQSPVTPRHEGLGIVFAFQNTSSTWCWDPASEGIRGMESALLVFTVGSIRFGVHQFVAFHVR